MHTHLCIPQIFTEHRPDEDIESLDFFSPGLKNAICCGGAEERELVSSQGDELDGLGTGVRVSTSSSFFLV